MQEIHTPMLMALLPLAATLRATAVVSKRHTTERCARSRCVVRLSPVVALPSTWPTGGWTRLTTTRAAECGEISSSTRV